MRRGLAITTLLRPGEQAFLRRLDHEDGEFVMADGLAEKVAGAALVQAGYAKKHPGFPHHFAIAAPGEYYLERLARAH